MARAKRHYLPGHVWHITHRCHKKEFLLKFARDRRRWIEWLFEARKRHGLKVLNYIVTSNHVHLLVVDGGGRHVIPDSNIEGRLRMVHKGQHKCNLSGTLEIKREKSQLYYIVVILYNLHKLKFRFKIKAWNNL